MLYDRKSFAVIKCASKEPSRFTIHGLQLEPSGEAAATNGKMLAVLSPSGADPKEFFRGEGDLAKPGKKGVILEAGMVAEVTKLIPKNAERDALNTAALTKCSDKEVEFTTHDGRRQRKIAEAPIEGTFPKYKDVLRPLYEQECVIMKINAQLLKALVETALSTTHGDESSAIEFRVPVENDRPVLFRAPCRDDGRMLIGAVMPVKSRGDTFDLSKWEKKFLDVKEMRGPISVEKDEPKEEKEIEKRSPRKKK